MKSKGGNETLERVEVGTESLGREGTESIGKVKVAMRQLKEKRWDTESIGSVDVGTESIERVEMGTESIGRV